ncbi:MAG TPA: hypothetical protein VK568_10125 [Thermodesulfobacteriota bacterium]|nr:hypothetical protein [Thermodesulfobacteriota bacterium]
MYETEEEQADIEWRIRSHRGWEPNRSIGKESRRVAQIALVPASVGAGNPLPKAKRPNQSYSFSVQFAITCNFDLGGKPFTLKES